MDESAGKHKLYSNSDILHQVIEKKNGPCAGTHETVHFNSFKNRGLYTNVFNPCSPYKCMESTNGEQLLKVDL